MKNLFFNKQNRSIYNGTNEAASFVIEASPLISEAEAKRIDKQEAQIRALKNSNNFYKFTIK